MHPPFDAARIAHPPSREGRERVRGGGRGQSTVSGVHAKNSLRFIANNEAGARVPLLFRVTSVLSRNYALLCDARFPFPPPPFAPSLCDINVRSRNYITVREYEYGVSLAFSPSFSRRKISRRRNREWNIITRWSFLFSLPLSFSSFLSGD